MAHEPSATESPAPLVRETCGVEADARAVGWMALLDGEDDDQVAVAPMCPLVSRASFELEWNTPAEGAEVQSNEGVFRQHVEPPMIAAIPPTAATIATTSQRTAAESPTPSRIAYPPRAAAMISRMTPSTRTGFAKRMTAMFSQRTGRTDFFRSASKTTAVALRLCPSRLNDCGDEQRRLPTRGVTELPQAARRHDHRLGVGRRRCRHHVRVHLRLLRRRPERKRSPNRIRARSLPVRRRPREHAGVSPRQTGRTTSYRDPSRQFADSLRRRRLRRVTRASSCEAGIDRSRLLLAVAPDPEPRAEKWFDAGAVIR